MKKYIVRSISIAKEGHPYEKVGARHSYLIGKDGKVHDDDKYIKFTAKYFGWKRLWAAQKYVDDAKSHDEYFNRNHDYMWDNLYDIIEVEVPDTKEND